MDIKKIFGLNVKKYRKSMGLTQMQFAEMLNVDQKHISFIESGNSFPSAGLISKIAEKLNIKPKSLFEFEEFPSINEIKDDILTMINSLSEENILKVHNFTSFLYVK